MLHENATCYKPIFLKIDLYNLFFFKEVRGCKYFSTLDED
jgi:hypothetical protein